MTTKHFGQLGGALLLVVLIAIAGLCGVKLLNVSQPQSARAFVSGFYDWYVPLALQNHAEPTWRIALRHKQVDFDPSLVRLFQADAAAQDKCEDLVGLDFDPFLNSQDPAERYEVGDIEQQGNTYTAKIYSVIEGQRSSRTEVSASFRRTNNRFVFVNFYYPNGGDLVTILDAPKLPCSAPRPHK